MEHLEDKFDEDIQSKDSENTNSLEDIVENVKQNQDIKAMNKRLIEAAIKLYAEKTHFVYELLQNAEDVGATHVCFVQYNDRLEVIHNGEPFKKSNLQSLCDAAKSDKQDQIDKIGKFGIGFKSVFAICDKVMLYTEPDNRPIEKALPHMAVRIDDYITPTLLNEEWKLDAPYTTRFVFPYDIKMYKKSVEELKIDVAKKLRDLGADVLLFMKNIEQIEYRIIGISNDLDGKNVYRLDREIIGEQICKVKTHGNTGRKESDSQYLVFSKNIEDSARTVDIAFSIIEEKGKIEFNKALSPYISMYFPTETESKLNFIVQAPFDLTSNRSSLEEDSEHNEDLKALLMNLYVEVIFEMKRRSWLTLELISLLPYNIDDREISSINYPFRSINTKTFDLLNQEAIIPASDGSYITAKNAKIARSAKLTELFGGQKLDLLLDSSGSKWLATNFTINSSLRELHVFFTKLLQIEEITSNDLSSLIRHNSILLKSADNQWLSDFYGWLAKDVSTLLGRNSDFATVPFVKTSDGNFNQPITLVRNGRSLERKDNIFIRPKNSTYDVEGILFLDDWVFNNCPEFVDALGLPKPDDFMYYKKELEARKGFKPTDNDDDISPVRQAIKYIREDRNNIKEELAGLIWIRVINPFNGDPYFTTSFDSIYREKDFNGVSLLNYFSGVKSALPVCVLDETYYNNNGFSEYDFSFLEQFGVKDTIYEGLVGQQWRERPTDYFNSAGFIKNLNFARISDVLNEIVKDYNNKDLQRAGQKSSAVFSLLKNVDKNLKNETTGDISQILKLLGSNSSNKWLIASNGRLVNPSEITQTELVETFYGPIDRRTDIYELLGFKKTQEDKKSELIDEFMRRFSKEQQEIIINNYIKLESDETDGVFDPDVDDEYKDFPEDKIRDLDRLCEKTRQKYSDAPTVKYEDVLRRVRTSRDIRRDKSHIKYRYKGYCQLCEDPHHYWEIAGIFNVPNKELQEMNLSLCPACATEYRILRSDNNLMNAFAREIENADANDDPSVAIGDKYIRFTSTHLAEVQEVVRIERANKRI